MLRLGFQTLLSSVILRYFLLKSDGVLRLENRLPKRHGGSNPSSCAKNEAPILAVGAFIFAWNEWILTPLCDSPSRRMGFAYPTRRSKSSLFRRRVWVSSPKVNTPLPSRFSYFVLNYLMCFLNQSGIVGSSDDQVVSMCSSSRHSFSRPSKNFCLWHLYFTT